MASSSSAIRFYSRETNSTILPNPSKFFSPHLLSSPLPTNSFFQNFTQKRPFCLEYKWETKGTGNLLILAHPLHLRLLSSMSVIMDGNLTGVVGDSWVLKTNPILFLGIRLEVLTTKPSGTCICLIIDVEGLNSKAITTDSSYFYGKKFVSCMSFREVVEFLKDSMSHWLDGKFDGNGFLFDPKWGGIVCEKCLVDSKEDFGFGVYNNHHYHLGHFLYAIAATSLLFNGDFMNFNTKMNPHYPRLRNFDLWKLRSWAGGLDNFFDGRNQQYRYGDMELVAISSTIAAMEIQAALKPGGMSRKEVEYNMNMSLVNENRVVGVLWANKRDNFVFDLVFVRELVKWVSPALATENWKGFAYALEGLYNKESALQKIRSLEKYDDETPCEFAMVDSR
ncbi:hypothetical protein MKW92_033844 [Papaver armeniacum]|nr:hypothetical protein MKW92_033844 [Papaver armeniacum]